MRETTIMMQPRPDGYVLTLETDHGYEFKYWCVLTYNGDRLHTTFCSTRWGARAWAKKRMKAHQRKLAAGPNNKIVYRLS